MTDPEIQGYLLKNFPSYEKDREAVFTYLQSLGLDNGRIKSLGDYWRGYCLNVKSK